MTKRNITIAGIVLILIAIAIIGVVRSQVGVASAGVREPVALNVGSGVVQANLARSVRREVTVDVGEQVNTSAVKQMVDALGVTRTMSTVGRLVVQQVKGVELAVVLRAVVTGVDQVRVTLV